MAVAVLMLETFTGKSGAPRGASEQKAPGTHVRSGPNEIGDALETEHRVINEERNRVHAVRGVCGAGGDEGSHRSGFSNPFLQNLAALRFVVVKEHVAVDRLVFLADARIDACGAEERFHAE